MMAMNVSGLVAFTGGLMSFFAPCALPLVPSFLIYMSGTTITEARDLSNRANTRQILPHCLSFIAGFTLLFLAFGFSSSVLGGLLRTYETWIMRAGGLILIVMGLNMLDIVRIPFLNREKVVHLGEGRRGYVRSFAMGLTFSLGWTSCLSPVLGSILLIASTSGKISSGVYLLGLYSLGLAMPFFISALLISRLMDFIRRWGHAMNYTSKAVAGLLVLLGLFFLSGYWKVIAELLV
jgi:cytochrome c-type biogenesis protein